MKIDISRILADNARLTEANRRERSATAAAYGIAVTNVIQAAPTGAASTQPNPRGQSPKGSKP